MPATYLLERKIRNRVAMELGMFVLQWTENTIQEIATPKGKNQTFKPSPFGS